MKKILGLDIGTNSIGWALTEQDFDNKKGRIIDLGVRIIPMSQDILSKFDSGVSISQTAERTRYRGIRRLRERHLLRRERLHRVLNIMNFLPKHYAQNIDFENRKGQFIDNKEVKLNYKPEENGQFTFVFQDSFQEMLQLFKDNGYSENIPYDWTLYYLRKKALQHKISKEELAWLLLNFNQKRGYYELREEEEKEKEEKDVETIEEFYALKVVSVEEDKNSSANWYLVHLENGFIYRRKSTEPLDDWVGMTKEFIVTTTLDKDGTPKKDKEGDIKRSFRMVDSEKDWIAIKKKTEHDINNSGKQVGTYIFDTLLKNPTQKINGKLVKTIERKYYKEELKAILKKQKEFHTELNDKDLYYACIEELYPHNEAHRSNISDKDFTYLFVDDIIFYQRPLKSKKSTISDCSYEVKKYIKDGEKLEKPLKCIAKSHPLYQEFRLWQFIQNLRIYKKQGINEKGEVQINQDITQQLLPDEEAYTNLFDFLNELKEVEQYQLLKYFSDLKKLPKISKSEPAYTWNYVEDKKYPCNTSHSAFVSRLKKVKGIDVETFLTKEVEQHLWHIIYSVKDKKEFEKALGTFAEKYAIDTESFVENFKKFPPFLNDYGAYSEKALKKLVPLMRMGKYWSENDISDTTKENISDIMERLEDINFEKEKFESVTDDLVSKQLLKSFASFKDKNPLKGLNTYQACYAVYKRHSEAAEITQWKSPKDIEHYLNHIFKQHQLRNPIVEQIATETLRLVHDIWEYYGDGADNFFSEIHVELGREMKNPADKRKEMSDKNTEREKTNQRIKAILEELANDDSMEVKPRPYSPSHQEILKIYEEGVFENQEASDEIKNIRKSTSPTKSQILKYKLWLEQGYVSPYTLQMIPLTKLFSSQYQIEHIIPQSRYFDDSMNNKIICESVINEEKGNATAYEFIKARGGEKFDLGQNKIVTLAKFDDYEAHCSKYFRKNRLKLKNLLADEIPSGFIERQLNDSRYISKYIKGLLSNIVREDGENQVTANRLVHVNGTITAKLRHDWGLNDKWNEIVQPRFERMNEITNSQDFGFWDKSINAFRIQVPDEISKGFSTKRIDHRHHALDALVVACTTKDHTNYITSLNTERKNFSLVKKLREVEEVYKNDPITKERKLVKVAKAYKKPWDGFTLEAKNKLEEIVVSFKQNLRVINRTNNKFQKWVEQPNGQYKKEWIEQKGKNFAIRKPMHKETVSGKVYVKQEKKGIVALTNTLNDWELIKDDVIKEQVKKLIKQFKGDISLVKKHLKEHPIKKEGKKVEKIKVFEFVEATASRSELTDKFTQKQLDSVTDSGIRKILQNHVNKYVDKKGNLDFSKAFSPEGIEAMNANIQELNGGKAHQPIYKVRIYEVGNKFSVGEVGNKKDKYVESAKGTNLFFAIYWDEEKKKRNYETVPLNEVIEHQKQMVHLPKNERTELPIKPEIGRFLFSLSPNDLVFVPTQEEMDNPNSVNFNSLTKEQSSRIYKMVSSTGNQCFFVLSNVANTIYNKKEFSALNKMEKSIDDIMVKEICWKLEIDRLGNIKRVIQN
ncbi:type II CRISPR RNA-guided endonuclease Cas9 [Riemerella columbina]|uniref:type II CRISPR RNA-guided endonuclease Cas9 n=1 Tax=Riemerella columbina TaxID=103810 RepID=UPI0003680B84|nr:type II CRISPR RNA-guided endonuclease Cas9 [Riemerella columbina]